MSAPTPTPDPTPVVVVGGAGAVGAMLTRAWRATGSTVHVLDPNGNPAAGDRTERLDALTAAGRATLATAGTVVLAVPEPVAVAALGPLQSLLAPHALLVETLSVKTPVAAAAAGLAARGGVVGLNPMFAPSLGMTGRPVAVVVHHQGPAVAGLLARLRDWGTRPVTVTADEHDRITAATQALTHAAILAFGAALDRLDVPAGAAATAPPPHEVLRALLGRVGAGAPEVYHDIQVANPHAAAARAALRAAVDELDAAARTADPAPFTTVMRRAQASLGDRAGHYTDLCAALFATLPVVGGADDE